MGPLITEPEPLPRAPSLSSSSVLGEWAWVRPPKEGIRTLQRDWRRAVSFLPEESRWDGRMKDALGGFPDSSPEVFRLQGLPRQESQGEEGSPKEVSFMPSLVRENFPGMFPLKMYQGVSHPFLPCIAPART